MALSDEPLQTIPVLRSGIDIRFRCETYICSLHHYAAILSIVLCDWRGHLSSYLDRIRGGLEIECLVVVHLTLSPGRPGDGLITQDKESLLLWGIFLHRGDLQLLHQLETQLLRPLFDLDFLFSIYCAMVLVVVKD
jgi:hypothetical protein